MNGNREVKERSQTEDGRKMLDSCLIGSDGGTSRWE